MTLTVLGSLVAAGAVGAPARFLVDSLVQSRGERLFPWGTFVVNVTGSLLLGLITGAALYHGLGDTPRILLGTGFCGSYTTFSAFTFETVRLLEQRAVRAALLNAAASLAVGSAAAALGLGLAALL